MSIYQCFFCRYRSIENLNLNNRTCAQALELPEYSVVREIEADSKEDARKKFLEKYEDDYDELHGLKYPQCVRIN